MQRAGIFIGVAQTGGLPFLPDAVPGARQMHQWAISQGMEDQRSAILVTDEDGTAVTPDLLCDVVSRVLEEVAPEQLIVYFAGHGTARLYGEQWLLSKAPENPAHAVDVDRCLKLAMHGEVPHVVFISDACRTAPDGINALAVTGSPIFPNVQSARPAFVDIFYACSLGRPSLEVKDAAQSAATYRAVFTEVLLEVLNGTHPEAFTNGDDDSPERFAECRPVRDLLTELVPDRIEDLKLSVGVNQVPEARIYSDPGAWLARLKALGPSDVPVPNDSLSQRAAIRPGGPLSMSFPAPGPAAPWPRWRVVTPASDLMPAATALTSLSVERTADLLSASPAAERVDVHCGIAVHGDVIAEVYDAGLQVERIGPDTLRCLPHGPGSAGTVLLTVGSGSMAAVPLVDGMVAVLHLDDGELLSMAWEPSRTAGARWEAFAARASTIRELRGLAAAASAHGRFQPDDHGRARLAEGMRYGGHLDPSLAILAAYDLYAAEGGPGDREVPAAAYLAESVADDLGMALFDLELLAGRPVDSVPLSTVSPPVPLLSQGWQVLLARLDAEGRSLPEPLLQAHRLARNSLWSLFDPRAVGVLSELLEGSES